ncbi:MAG: hypothetical protein HY540_02130 [Deltaproteobacteria bacterium]|nr:hypothetical protein [Deltaproteobacteria bacterium]
MIPVNRSVDTSRPSVGTEAPVIDVCDPQNVVGMRWPWAYVKISRTSRSSRARITASGAPRNIVSSRYDSIRESSRLMKSKFDDNRCKSSYFHL